jgi:DNA replication and repair protein RecF
VRLLSLELKDFRNHRDIHAALDGEPTLLLGENGSGKTNWVEAAVLLSIGRSFRGARDRELTRRGADGFEVKAVIADRAGVTHEIVARGGAAGGRAGAGRAREVEVDGEALPRLADLLGRFPTVHFSVEDVASLNGAPAGRRRFLDVALCQLEPVYVGHLRDYAQALRQRNTLLASGAHVSPEDRAQLSAWEEILARAGVELDRRRIALTRELNAVLDELARAVDADGAAVEYAGMDGAEGEGGAGAAGAAAAAGPANDLAVARRAERLEGLRMRDRRLGWTSEGPHRARMHCRIEGRDLVDGASRGMTRIYSILLRIALARVVEARMKEPPVVLLDDPESELDARWIGRLLALVPETSQAVVTACRPLSESPARFRTVAIASLGDAEASAGVTAAVSA